VIPGALLGTVRTGLGVADIWFAWVNDSAYDVARLSGDVLSDAERVRVDQYRNPDAACRYVVTRALVRGVLSQRLGVAPRAVDVRVTDLGKPVVSDDLHFNVTHSAELIMLAVSSDRAVGIDVERRREVKRAGALITRWLTPSERDNVGALQQGGLSESDAFLRVWSAKEARLKALGVGISGATTADVAKVVAVPLDELLAKAAGDAGGYVGAVAFA
jgi:4'-phosphopantetheinyl transferase